MTRLDPLRHVKFYAAIKHAGQPYAGGLPYTHHLAAVEAVLRRFGVTSLEILEAAWLHDVVEDQGVKLKEIREMFGDDVARLVAAVTDEPGPNRKTRKALTYPKTRKAGTTAVCLKLADRIANAEQGGLGDMYYDEYPDFRHALYTAGENEDMWAHLDKLMDRSETVPCIDHWHCDPGAAAHDCFGPDRSKPCPSCGAT